LLLPISQTSCWLERAHAKKTANRHFIKRSEQNADARHVVVPQRERTRQRTAVDAEDRHTGLPGRPLMVHNDGDDPGIEIFRPV